MSSYRLIETGIWSDERFTDLSAAAQLVYLRLVTGDDTSSAGSTEVRPKRIAVDTNLERGDVEQAIDELIGADLVRRYDDWLWMPTWIKHQVHGSGFIRSARRAAKGSPDGLRKAIGRAIDAHVGVRNSTSQTTSAESRTENPPVSREDRDPPPDPPANLNGGSSDPLRAGYLDQDQDPLPTEERVRMGLGDETSATLAHGGQAASGDELKRVDLDSIQASMPPAIKAAMARARKGKA